MTALGTHTLLGTSGDMSDYQHLTSMLHRYHVAERCHDDGHLMTPRQWYTALAAVLYKRRSESNPLWTANVVAGVEADGNIFLGSCDLLGTQFQADSIATGYGAHLAQPLLRDALQAAETAGQPLSETDALALIKKCMQVLYYRDARSLDKVSHCHLRPPSHSVPVDSNGHRHQGRRHHFRSLHSRVRLVHCLSECIPYAIMNAKWFTAVSSLLLLLTHHRVENSLFPCVRLHANPVVSIKVYPQHPLS